MGWKCLTDKDTQNNHFCIVVIMSRTYRKPHYNKAALRNPKTRQEIKQLNHILDDVKSGDYEVSGVNHLHHRLSVLPTHWEDIVVSAYYQTDYDR